MFSWWHWFATWSCWKKVCLETFTGNWRWSTGNGTERLENLSLVKIRPIRQIIGFCKMNRNSSHEEATTASAKQTRSVRRFKTSETWTPVTKWPTRLETSNERWKWTFRDALFGYLTLIVSWTRIYQSWNRWTTTTKAHRLGRRLSWCHVLLERWRDMRSTYHRLFRWWSNQSWMIDHWIPGTPIQC